MNIPDTNATITTPHNVISVPSVAGAIKQCPDCAFATVIATDLLAHMAGEHSMEHEGELPWVDDDGRRGWTERAMLES